MAEAANLRDGSRAGAPADALEDANRCLRDILALSALPAMWAGAEPLRVAESLAAALYSTLDPHFVFILLAGGSGQPAVAVAQTGRYDTSPDLAESIRSELWDWARTRDPHDILLLPDPRGAGVLRVAMRPLGHGAELGLIAAGFIDENAPAHDHHLALNVAATQAVTALQNANLLARQAADLIERTEAETALRRQGERLEALNRIAKAVASDLDLDRIVQTVTDSATQLSGAKFGAFFYNVTDARGERYLLYSLSGAPREAFDKFGIPRNTAVFEPTFRGTGIVRSDDIRTDPRYGRNAPHNGMPRGHLPVVSYLAVPVVSRSADVHGGLFFGHDKPGMFTEETEEIVAGIAAHAAIALDNARLLKAARAEIEKRERTEEELRESEARFRRLVEGAPFGIYIVDAQFRIAHMNERSQAGAFQNVRPVIGRDFNDAMRILWPEKIAQEICAIFGHTLETGESYYSKDFVNPRADIGAVEGYEWELQRILLPDGQFGVICYYFDSSELRQAEAALRENEAYQRLLLESAAEAFYAVNREGTTTLCNAAFVRMLGFASEADVIGRTLHDLIHHSHPDGSHYAKEDCPIYRTARDGTPAHVDNELFFRLDGSSLPVEYWARPILRDGEHTGAICTFVDITHRKQAEEQRQLLVHELNHRVKNTLAMVQAIAAQTFHGERAEPLARVSFDARLRALAAAHDILTHDGWRDANIADLILEAISPHRSEGADRFQIEGAPVRVPPQLALTLAMVLHELVTNAAKYGALSVPGGSVWLSWRLDRRDSEEVLRLQWQERGGPRVQKPKRKGFGTRLIERSFTQSAGGEVALRYEPAGLLCTISAPLAS